MALSVYLIPGIFLLLFLGLAVFAKGYVVSVVGFLAANRCAKRYLLTAAEGAAGIGAISIIAQFEVFQSAGFTAAYWEMIFAPLWLVLALSGWIIYRFRETRCLTMAQFLELRYSRGFRILCGIVMFLSGIINYGIFPAVSARFFVYTMNMPVLLNLPFGVSIPTYIPVMVALLSTALFIVFKGGQVVIIVTDFLQGQLINIVFVILSVFVLLHFSWDDLAFAMKMTGSGVSRINPFDTERAETFTYWFFLIILFGKFYGYMLWQGNQGYNASAKSAHEARMARILGQWRVATMSLLPLLCAAATIIVLNHPDYVDVGARLSSSLNGIDDSTIANQVRTPLALVQFLPPWLLGCFLAVMLAASISTDTTYLHSWGSIFIQDVVMPIRERPFAADTHLRLLKFSILGVGAFVFIFSIFFAQTEYIIMFFQITGALFAAGAGVAVIGGLYWSRGTTEGAWAGMLTGICLVISGFVLNRTIEAFPLNYVEMVFVSQISSTVVYVVTSLLTGKGHRFDLKRMLHRDETEGRLLSSTGLNMGWREKLEKRLGFSAEFTRTDRVIYYATIGLLMSMLAAFFILLFWNFILRPGEDEWLGFWHVFVWVNLSIGIAITTVILVGGISNLFDMFRDLKENPQNTLDDGFVVNGHNRGEKLE